jgi:hypothetical protein
MTETNPGIDNLIAWWSMNETSGDRADSRNGLTATDYNTVTYDDGIQSNAAKFTAANSEYFYVSDNDKLDITGAFSFGFWFKTPGAPESDCGIFDKLGAYGVRHAGTAGANDHKFYFLVNGTIRATSGTAFNDDAWHLGIFVYNLTTAKIYVDLVEDGTGNYSTAVASNAAVIAIGSRTDISSYYNGLLDEVFLFDKALSADEMEWLYNSGAGRKYSDLTGAATPYIPRVIYF